MRSDADHPRHKVWLRRFIAIDLSILLQFVGPSAIIPYGALITSLVLPDLITLIPLLLITINGLCSVFLVFLLAKFGRKPIYQIGTFGTIIGLIMITVGFFIDSS